MAQNAKLREEVNTLNAALSDSASKIREMQDAMTAMVVELEGLRKKGKKHGQAKKARKPKPANEAPASSTATAAVEDEEEEEEVDLTEEQNLANEAN